MPVNPTIATSTRNGPERAGSAGPSNRPTTAATTTASTVNHGPAVRVIVMISPTPAISGHNRHSVASTARHHGRSIEAGSTVPVRTRRRATKPATIPPKSAIRESATTIRHSSSTGYRPTMNRRRLTCTISHRPVTKT